MKIGIMGGTFDPPHLAHVIPVEAAAAEFHLDRVYFIPNYIPPHKGQQPGADPFHRSAMLALALQRYPSFLFSAQELLRGTVSYTVQTVADLLEQFPSPHKLFFIMGSDSFLEIQTWYEYQRLLRMVNLIIIDRGAHEGQLTANLQTLEENLQLDLTNTVHFASSPFLPISSTEIRNKLQSGEDVSTMLAPEVEHYIRKHSIYMRR